MIGIFDSGMGGLTVLRAVRDRLPSADVAYFGDTKNAPYGQKTREELTDLTVAGIRFLQEKGATNIVSACNSVSASLAISLLDAFSLQPAQLIEMVGPTVSFFRGSNSRLALCATQATIRSGLYQNAFRMIGKDVPGIAIPNLASLIESDADADRINACIAEALAPHMGSFDILILGCTHYPLVEDAFQTMLGSGVSIFDPALAVAARVERQFWPQESGSGETRFFLSKDSKPFRSAAAAIMNRREYTVEVIE